MKVFQNNSIFKKIVIVFLIIMSFSFVTPKNIQAKSSDKGIGGQLLDPLLSMFVGLGDGAISLLQKLVLQMDGSMIEVDTSASNWAKLLGVVVAVLVVAGGIAALFALPRSDISF